MTDTQLSLQSKDHNNKYYYIIFVDTFNKDKIQDVLNHDGPIGFCSLIYKPEYNYVFADLLEYVTGLDKKYDWKLHEITLPQYPFTESIDVVLDTNIRKNKTTHYIVYDNIIDCNADYIAQIDPIFKSVRNVDAIMKQNDPYNGLVIPFSTHMILNKNNHEPLINKLVENEKNVVYI